MAKVDMRRMINCYIIFESGFSDRDDIYHGENFFNKWSGSLYINIYICTKIMVNLETIERKSIQYYQNFTYYYHKNLSWKSDNL